LSTTPDDPGAPTAGEDFLESLTDTSLYTIGAFFADRYPDLTEDVIAQATEIEALGLERWAAAEEIDIQRAFQTLITGLAVRYYKAVAGSS
jgi:hypothetical protein